MKTTKYLISAVLGSSMLCSAGQAAGCHDLSKAHHGFYVGANAGYVTGQTNIKHDYVINPANKTSDKSSLSGKGAIGGLNLGYQHHFTGSRIVAGLDLKGTFSGLSGKSHTNLITFGEVRNRVKMTNSLGAALRLGVLWHNVLPYVKVGYVSSTWKTQSQLLPTINANAKTNNRKKRLNGAEFGVGIDIPMTESLTVGGEYSFEKYQKLSQVHKGRLNDTQANIKYKPTTNQFVFRVKYKLSGFGF
jgi:opacity protein-like surface antigen